MTLIERLRLYKPIDNTSSLINEAADLLESQAARIAELESYNQTRTDEMIAATRRIAELTSMVDEHGAEMWKQGEEYAILSCKQAEALARIAELEAERDWLHHKSECLNMERKSQDRELAALHRKIDEAPVVSWRCEHSGETYHFGFQQPDPRDWDSCIQLISKEDLQK